ncbi:acyl-CoA dehydrogenase family protein [Paenibacillus glucanolyticus]|uniref:acyl-CoA dehydrogenase family protein n=1 Tax=Paenibacillus glucanolyticus TaxID=59843 RepID=UPI003697F3CC
MIQTWSVLKERFFMRAEEYDRNRTFPHVNFDEIVEHNLHTVTLERDYGGREYGFRQLAEALVAIGSGCPSTALCMAMHYYTLGGLRNVLSPEMKEEWFRAVERSGEFTTSFNQPNIPVGPIGADGGRGMSSITVKSTNDGYVVNGIKPFVSGCERFYYFPILAFHEDMSPLTTYPISALLLTKDDQGVTILDNSWDYSGMKATKSHSISLQDVFVPKHRLIGREGYGIEDTSSLAYWSRLAVSAVYIGAAQRAVEYVTALVKRKTDSLSRKPLAQMPGTQFSYAEMLIQMETAYNQLFAYADFADQCLEKGEYPEDLLKKALITKAYVSKTVNEVVWNAMQMEGMASFKEGGVLERLYRDVRAATFHQPSDDLLHEVLAKKSLGVISLRNRWL